MFTDMERFSFDLELATVIHDLSPNEQVVDLVKVNMQMLAN